MLIMLVTNVKQNKRHPTKPNGKLKLGAITLFYTKGHEVTQQSPLQVLSEPSTPTATSSEDHSLLRTTTPSLSEIPAQAA